MAVTCWNITCAADNLVTPRSEDSEMGVGGCVLWLFTYGEDKCRGNWNFGW